MKFLIHTLILLVGLNARAWVDEASANFVLSRVDYQLAGPGIHLVLQRTYNSVSQASGWFGEGWCSTLETSITVVSPQTLVVQECGVGHADVFSVKNFDPKIEQQAIDQLVKSARDSLTKLPVDFKQTIAGDVVLRARLTRSLGLSVKALSGAEFVREGSADRVTTKSDGFVRTRANGELNKFLLTGELALVVDSRGGQIKLQSEHGLVKSMIDPKGARLYFSRDASGRVTKVTGPNNRQVEYSYSSNGDLLKTKSSDGVEEFSYDSNHRMTEASIGGHKVQLKYDETNERVVETQFDGCRESFKYDLAEAGSGSFSVANTLTCTGQKPVQTVTKYRYENLVSGLRAKTSELFSDSRGAVTSKSYDGNGRLSKLEYAQANGSKISYGYSYDLKGGLQKVDLGGHRAIDYAFDPVGRLHSLKDSRGREIVLDYTGSSKRALSVHRPGETPVSLISEPTDRAPASLESAVETLSLYEELYTPAIPIFAGRRK